MPLCNGVRPNLERVPDMNKEHELQKYTSKTTDAVRIMMDTTAAEDDVTREMLEKSLTATGHLSKYEVIQLLDGVFGNLPHPRDYRHRRRGFTGEKDVQEKQLRMHLGTRVMTAWAENLKDAGIQFENEGDEGAFTFQFGDKQIILAKASTEQDAAKGSANQPSAAAQKSDGKHKEKRKGPVQTQEVSVNPNVVLPIIKEAIRITFEVPWIQMDKLLLTVAELVGVVHYSLKLHLPFHTDREIAHFQAFKKLCEARLNSLFFEQDQKRFHGMEEVHNWKKEYLHVVSHFLLHRSPWQTTALHTMFIFHRKLQKMREEEQERRGVIAVTSTTRHKKKEKPRSRRISVDEGKFLEEMAANALDPEWFDRVRILQKRDRRVWREKLEKHFEESLRIKQSGDSDDEPQSPEIRPGGGGQEWSRTESEKASTLPQPPVSPMRALKNHLQSQESEEEVGRTQQLWRRGSRASLDLLRSMRQRTGSVHFTPKTASDITPEAILDIPRYWLDTRLCHKDNREGEKPLSTRQEMVLRSIIRDEHDVHLKKGKHAKSAKTVAAAALQRSHQATDADAAAHLSPNLVNFVQDVAGVIPGQVPKDDLETDGASRGACVFRLVPSFEKHEGERARHPVFRPSKGKLKTFQQFLEVQNLLKHPCMNGKGEVDHVGPILARPPIATPKKQRQRMERKLEQERLAKLAKKQLEKQQDKHLQDRLHEHVHVPTHSHASRRRSNVSMQPSVASIHSHHSGGRLSNADSDSESSSGSEKAIGSPRAGSMSPFRQGRLPIQTVPPMRPAPVSGIETSVDSKTLASPMHVHHI